MNCETKLNKIWGQKVVARIQYNSWQFVNQLKQLFFLTRSVQVWGITLTCSLKILRCLFFLTSTRLTDPISCCLVKLGIQLCWCLWSGDPKPRLLWVLRGVNSSTTLLASSCCMLMQELMQQLAAGVVPEVVCLRWRFRPAQFRLFAAVSEMWWLWFWQWLLCAYLWSVAFVLQPCIACSLYIWRSLSSFLRRRAIQIYFQMRMSLRREASSYSEYCSWQSSPMWQPFSSMIEVSSLASGMGFLVGFSRIFIERCVWIDWFQDSISFGKIRMYYSRRYQIVNNFKNKKLTKTENNQANFFFIFQLSFIVICGSRRNTSFIFNYYQKINPVCLCIQMEEQMLPPELTTPTDSRLDFIKNVYLLSASIFVSFIILTRSSEAPAWLLIAILAFHLYLVLKREVFEFFMDYIWKPEPQETDVSKDVQTEEGQKKQQTDMRPVFAQLPPLPQRQISRPRPTSSNNLPQAQTFSSLRQFAQKQYKVSDTTPFPKPNSIPVNSRPQTPKKSSDDQYHSFMEKTGSSLSPLNQIVNSELKQLQRSFEKQMQKSTRTNFHSYSRSVDKIRLLLSQHIRNFYRSHIDNLAQIDFITKKYFRLSLTEIGKIKATINDQGVGNSLFSAEMVRLGKTTLNQTLHQIRCFKLYGFSNWKWINVENPNQQLSSPSIGSPESNNFDSKVEQQVMAELIKLAEARLELDSYIALETRSIYSANFDLRLRLYRRLYTIGCDLSPLQEVLFEDESPLAEVCDSKLLYRFIERLINKMAAGNQKLKLRCEPINRMTLIFTCSVQYCTDEIVDKNCALIEERDSGIVQFSYLAGTEKYFYHCEPGEDLNVVSMFYFFLLNIKLTHREGVSDDKFAEFLALVQTN